MAKFIARSTRLMAGVVLWGGLTAGLHAAESIGGKAPARAARSVHLQWSAAESEAFYLEATVEQSTAGSYFMACGWSGGYFGIQETIAGEKVAIFSVWDPTKGDDPKAVTPEQRVELLYEGVGVRIKRFGGEGTGGQCMVDFPWAVGEKHRFFVRAEAQGDRTAYAGWIFEPRTGAWRHLVTFRTRAGGKLLRGLYSFVEDFRRDTRSVEDMRRARFFNAWVKPMDGGWRAVTQAKFTASRADWEARDTINAGVAEAGFLLATGGATTRETELSTTMTVGVVPTKPPGDLPAAAFRPTGDAVAK